MNASPPLSQSGFDRAGWPRAAPFLLYLAVAAAAEGVAHLARAGISPFAGWDLRLAYPVKAVSVALVLAALWHSYGELRPVRIKAGQWGLALSCGVLVFLLWINLDQPWATLGSAAGYDPGTPSGGLRWDLVAFRLFGAAVVVPVMEELFWRSLILRWIDNPKFLEVRPAAVSAKAFLITAALFALEHHLWFAGLLAGLTYNWLYRQTGNLWVAIAAHAVTNGLLGAWVLWTGSWRFW